jgi:phytanoyl-CoA hydroxylase
VEWVWVESERVGVVSGKLKFGPTHFFLLSLLRCVRGVCLRTQPAPRMLQAARFVSRAAAAAAAPARARACPAASPATRFLSTSSSTSSPSSSTRAFAAASAATRSASTSSAGSSATQQESFARHAKEYREDGYTIVRNVIDADLAGEMGDHVAFVKRRFPGVPPEHWHHLIMRNDAFWVRLVSDPRLIDLAQGVAPFLADGNVAVFSSHYFNKEPRTGMDVLPHQDGSYWPLRPMDVLTLWIAVDRSDPSNGCLRVVRGSHTKELQELKPDRSTKNVLGSATHTWEELDAGSIVDLVLNPGDVSIHHPNIVHGSLANRSDRRRCGLTVRYISTRTQCVDPEQPVLLVRGKAVEGVNEYRSWPKYRPGYDMPFRGAEGWNARRHVNPSDEAYFARTDYPAMEKEIKDGLWAFIDKLGGR